MNGLDDLSRRDFLKLSAAGVGTASMAAILAACSSESSQGTTTLNALFMQQAAYSNTDVQGMVDAFQKANPKITVKPTFVAYESLHDKIVTAAPAGTYDVVLIDVIWPPEFATKNEIIDVTNKFPSNWTSEIFPGALQTAQYQDKFYGVPWILDTKYFFYNKDILKAAGVNSEPKTWDDVFAAAKQIKSRHIIQYPLIWSWAQAEAVICDYAQLLGAYGGQFLDSSGKPAFNTGGGLTALEIMKKSIDDGTTNPASAESLNIVVAHTPSGPSGAAPGCNGSMALSIGSGSQHKDEAWKFIEFITSQDIQNQYAKLSLPIWKSSYDQPEVVSTLPEVVAVAKTQLNDMILRPQVPSYNEASAALQLEIQNALTGNKTPKQALDDAAEAWGGLLQS